MKTSDELLAELHQHVDAISVLAALLEESARESLLQHLDLMVANFKALLVIAAHRPPPIRGE